MKRLLAEAVGTAALVLIGCGSVTTMVIVNGGAGLGYADLGFIAAAFGLVVAWTVYVLGPISGNHINPAVTIALASIGRFPWTDVPGYIVAQLIGGCVGAAAVIGVIGPDAVTAGLGVAALADGVGYLQGFFGEAVGTFLLLIGIMGATSERAPKSLTGFIIGGTLISIIAVIGPYTGASLNPARSFAPMLTTVIGGGNVSWVELPLYVVAQIVGAVTAAFFTAGLRPIKDSVSQHIGAC